MYVHLAPAGSHLGSSIGRSHAHWSRFDCRIQGSDTHLCRRRSLSRSAAGILGHRYTELQMDPEYNHDCSPRYLPDSHFHLIRPIMRKKETVWEVHQQHIATCNTCFTRAAAELTAEGRLVSSIWAVSLAITHLSLCDAHLVCGTQPLTWWAAEWWSGTICFIAHIPAIIFPITNPALRHTVSISTLELYRTTGTGRAAIVLIRAILTVWMTITFPHFRNAKSVDLALELIVMAQTWPTCGCT